MPERGEIWQVDFGITQKVRPALVIGMPYGDRDRALVGVIPHTTATRGSQFEVYSLAFRRCLSGARDPGIPAEVFSAATRSSQRRANGAGRAMSDALARPHNEMNLEPNQPLHRTRLCRVGELHRFADWQCRALSLDRPG